MSNITIRKCDVCGNKTDSDDAGDGRIVGAYKNWDGQTFEVCENCHDDLFEGKAGKSVMGPIPPAMTSLYTGGMF